MISPLLLKSTKQSRLYQILWYSNLSSLGEFQNCQSQTCQQRGERRKSRSCDRNVDQLSSSCRWEICRMSGVRSLSCIPRGQRRRRQTHVVNAEASCGDMTLPFSPGKGALGSHLNQLSPGETDGIRRTNERSFYYPGIGRGKLALIASLGEGAGWASLLV